MSDIILKGMILGMEKEGALLHKVTDTHVYFNIPNTATIKYAGIKRASKAFREFGKILMVKCI